MNWIKVVAIALALSATDGVANAQQAGDVEAVKAANQSFYTALSARDLKAMQAVWADEPYVVNIGPPEQGRCCRV
jgi:ketosteroid isomerase-like protein